MTRISDFEDNGQERVIVGDSKGRERMVFVVYLSKLERVKFLIYVDLISTKTGIERMTFLIRVEMSSDRYSVERVEL